MLPQQRLCELDQATASTSSALQPSYRRVSLSPREPSECWSRGSGSRPSNTLAEWRDERSQTTASENGAGRSEPQTIQACAEQIYGFRSIKIRAEGMPPKGLKAKGARQG